MFTVIELKSLEGKMRQRAYALNGVRDPVTYTAPDPVAERILQQGGM